MDVDSKVLDAIIKAAQAAYPDGADLVRPDVEGDGLARFIYNELHDACVGMKSVPEAAQQAVGMLERAIADLSGVREAMVQLCDEGEEMRTPDECERLALEEYESLKGRLVRVSACMGYIDEDSVDLDCGDKPAVVRVLETRRDDILRWMDDECLDPVYDVEVVERGGLPLDLRSCWIYGTTQRTDGQTESGSIIEVLDSAPLEHLGTTLNAKGPVIGPGAEAATDPHQQAAEIVFKGARAFQSSCNPQALPRDVAKLQKYQATLQQIHAAIHAARLEDLESGGQSGEKEPPAPAQHSDRPDSAVAAKALVAALVHYMYFDEELGGIDLNKEIPGADFVEFCCVLVQQYGFKPRPGCGIPGGGPPRLEEINLEPKAAPASEPLHCPHCGACPDDARLEVVSGTFVARRVLLTEDGFDLMDAKRLDTEDEVVRCDACGASFPLSDVMWGDPDVENACPKCRDYEDE